QQAQHLAGQGLRLGVFLQAPRQGEEISDFLAAEVGEIEEAVHAGISANAARSRSTCSAASVYGGSRRRIWGSALVPARMSRWSSAFWMSLAGREVLSPSRNPAPCAPVTGPTMQVSRISAEILRTLASSSSRSMASITASTTAQAMG